MSSPGLYISSKKMKNKHKLFQPGTAGKCETNGNDLPMQRGLVIISPVTDATGSKTGH